MYENGHKIMIGLLVHYWLIENDCRDREFPRVSWESHENGIPMELVGI